MNQIFVIFTLIQNTVLRQRYIIRNNNIKKGQKLACFVRLQILYKAKYYKKKKHKSIVFLKEVLMNLSVEFGRRRHYWVFSYVYHVHEYKYPYPKICTSQLDSPNQTETLNIWTMYENPCMSDFIVYDSHIMTMLCALAPVTTLTLLKYLSVNISAVGHWAPAKHATNSNNMSYVRISMISVFVQSSSIIWHYRFGFTFLAFMLTL